MPQVSYRALTKSGELVAGDLAAPSRAEVVARLDYLGLLPVETREVAASAPQQSAGRFGRDRLVGLIGPIAIVSIAAIVGFLVVTLMNALMSIGQLTL